MSIKNEYRIFLGDRRCSYENTYLGGKVRCGIWSHERREKERINLRLWGYLLKGDWGIRGNASLPEWKGILLKRTLTGQRTRIYIVSVLFAAETRDWNIEGRRILT